MSTPEPKSARSRFRNHLEAQTWRGLMGVGMLLHRIPSGLHSPTYAFTKTILSSISTTKGSFDLLFYAPPGYKKAYGPRSRSPSPNPGAVRGKSPSPMPTKKYPVVVNFHGGGFTIGAAHDDSRWADAVVHEIDAVVVSVEYRLAPEHPFPTAVEDGADAVLYLIDHAEDLSIDPDRIGISGFSAGGNMAFTVPLRLQEEFRKRGEGSYKSGLVRKMSVRGDGTKKPVKGRICAIMAWYPPTDYATYTRTERRATNVRQDKSLPEFFTNLFDSSYLHGCVQLDSPYLSPGLASDDMLKALPADIIMYICEWDELRAEGEIFRDRLQTIPGKKVVSRIIEGVMHGFDKGPNPFWRDEDTEKLYIDACAELKRAIYDNDRDGE